MPEDKKEDKGYTVVDKRSHQADTGASQGPVGESAGAGADSEKTSETGQEKQAPSQGQQETGGQGKGKETAPLEEVTFAHLVLSLVASAYQYLEKEKDLPHTQQIIDVLGILQEKTKGNLTKEEEGLLKNVLFDLRMRYVEGIKK